MAGALSDRDWDDICAAAGRTADAKARRMLSAILFSEFPAFDYDPAREDARLKRSARMLKLLRKFAELYRQEWLPRLPAAELQTILTGRAEPKLPSNDNIDVKTERDLSALRDLSLRTQAAWHFASVIRRANAKRKSVQHEWLYYRLCELWLDHFHGGLHEISVPPTGGPPRGPLIAFILAAFRRHVGGCLAEPLYRA